MASGLRGGAVAALAVSALVLTGCTAGTSAAPAVTETVTLTGSGSTVTATAVSTATTAVTVTTTSVGTVVRMAVTTKTVEHSQPPTTITVPTTVIRLEVRETQATTTVTSAADPGTSPACNPVVPTVVLQAVSNGLSADGISRAAGIHAVTESIDHPGTYLVAAQFNPGGVAVWGIQGLSRFSWIEPANALARELTVTGVVPGNGPVFDGSSLDVQHAEHCIGD